MLEDYPRIKPCKVEDLEMLKALTAADGHMAIAPTYLVEKNKQIVGYIGSVNAVTLWMDTQRTKVRDTIMVCNFYENILAANGNGIIGVPCIKSSPFFPYLPKADYHELPNSSFFLKNLNP